MPRPSANRSSTSLKGRWALQDAKAQFSELVRKAQSEGPQHVTVHGRDSVVVVSEAEFRRLKGEPTGKLLVDLMANSPLKDIDLDRRSVKVKGRDIDL
ncbi:MAG: type II toxin-antitoxin system Phd/YefM family antitoxin [Hyphomicrobiaceae bacterium]